MHNGIKFTFIFALGAAAGSAVTWHFLKTKYEQIAQEEIESVKEVFYERGLRAQMEPVEEAVPEEVKTEYNAIVNNYVSNDTEKKGGSDDMYVDEPYVISPDEFGDIDLYETLTLTYYSDGVLADENDDPIEDISGIVPEDFDDHFGEYEECADSVFVRNDSLKCDYEILKDDATYGLNLADDE